MKNKITIKQFFENEILALKAYPKLVRNKEYQLAVRDNCLRICKSRNIKISKLQMTKTKSVYRRRQVARSAYLFDESIIKEAISKETEAKKPRCKNVK